MDGWMVCSGPLWFGGGLMDYRMDYRIQGEIAGMLVSDCIS